MRIEDRVYGNFEVEEDVLIELINSKPMQRLKELNQYGMPNEYYHKENFSRFDHSIGVFLLLRKLGAGLDEQVSGLLHDVSHTAFSHVVDWAIGNKTNEDFQDNNHLNVIESTEVKGILDKYGFDYRRIADMESFSLLETEIPSLCADRVDYCLRELKQEGYDVSYMVDNLSTHNGQVVFRDSTVAMEFGNEFLKLNNEHWSGEQAVVRYIILSRVLKKGIKNGVILMEDFYRTDEEVIDMLRLGDDREIVEELDLIKNLYVEVVNDGSGVSLKKKFRYVDPEVLVNGSTRKLSEMSEEYGSVLAGGRERSKIERRAVFRRL